MNCNIIQDLLPLYVDEICSEDTRKEVETHLASCKECMELKKMLTVQHQKDLQISETELPYDKPFQLLKVRQASILHCLSLIALFVLLTAGVSLEAATPCGEKNGLFCVVLIIPGFCGMCALINFLFLQEYKNRTSFIKYTILCYIIAFLLCTIWAFIHYSGSWMTAGTIASCLLTGCTVLFCCLIIGNKYAIWQGKE